MSELLSTSLGKDNNPRKMRDWLFLARLSHYPKFSTFVAAYEYAVECLYRRVSEGNDTADMAAFPLLFMMRHTLELGYKYSLFHLCRLNSTVFDPVQRKNGEGHSLTKLHDRLGIEYHNALKSGFIPDHDKESFEKYYSLTAVSMRRFDALDRSSTKTRFPRSDESSAFPDQETVNLLELKNEFDDAMILLTTMADVIGQYDGFDCGY